MLLTLPLPLGPCSESHDQTQTEKGYHHQFTETAPGVLGIGVAGGSDVGLTPEEVCELNGDEDREQEIDRP